MAAPAAVTALAQKAKREQWEQQPKERDLWYARFLRYVALGPSRSMSLVAHGERNHYPVSAHWPPSAKKHHWRSRAAAFDAAVAADPSLGQWLLNAMSIMAVQLGNQDEVSKEVQLLSAAVKGGGYQAPPDDDDEDTVSTTH